MGFNHYDVQTAMQGVAAPGEAIAQNRAEADRRQNLAIEQELRQRQLETEMRRLDVEQNREQLLGQGNVRAYLVPEGEDDAAGISFEGPKAGLDALMGESEKNGKKLVAGQPPDKTPPFSVVADHPQLGRITMHARSVEELKDMVNQVGDGQPPSGFQTGPTHNKQAWDAEQKKADNLEMEAGMTQDPIIKNYKLDQAKKVRSDADTFFKPKPAADPLVKLGEEPTDPTAVNPGKRYIYGTRSQVTSGAPTAPAAATMPQVRSKSERDKLPAGTKYLGPDGKTYIKN